MVSHTTMDSFEADVMSSDKPVIVDFYADWCGPCKRLAPVFEELALEVDDVSFFKVNVEEASDLAAQFSVQSIPTLILFKDGKPAERVMGFMPKEKLHEMIMQHA